MIQYRFREEGGHSFKAKAKSDAQIIGEELMRIRQKYGDLRPAHVVAEAKDPKNPLHRNLEWIDSDAAHAHRLVQARSLIRSIVTIEAPGREIPTFVSIKSESKGQRYEPIGAVLRSVGLRKQMLKQAETDLVAFQRRYNLFKEVVKAAEKPLEVVRGLLGDELHTD